MAKTSEQAQVTYNRLRKITVKDVMRGSVFSDKDGKEVPSYIKLVTDEQKSLKLFIVWGKTGEYHQEESGFKDKATGKAQLYQRFSGDFKARRFVDGACFEAYQLILDSFSESVLVNQIKHKEGEEVPFAFVVGIEPFKRGDEIKYRHTLQPVNVSDGELYNPLADVEDKLFKDPTILAMIGPEATKALTDQRQAS